jgi:hypothetical protein
MVEMYSFRINNMLHDEVQAELIPKECAPTNQEAIQIAKKLLMYQGCRLVTFMRRGISQVGDNGRRCRPALPNEIIYVYERVIYKHRQEAEVHLGPGVRMPETGMIDAYHRLSSHKHRVH